MKLKVFFLGIICLSLSGFASDDSSTKTCTLQLTVEGQRLLSDLRLALETKKYVAFRTARTLNHDFFEGYVSGIKVKPDGSYKIRVHEDLSSFPVDYDLNEIIADSFILDPKPAAFPKDLAWETRSSSSVSAFRTVQGRTRTFRPSMELLDVLDRFSRKDEISGNELPVELTEAVPQDSELRIYFARGEKEVRLVIRRKGDWSFGTSALDKDKIFEGNPYTVNEEDSLLRTKVFAAYALRTNMRAIRYMLLYDVVRSQFSEQAERWGKVIPEGRGSIEECFLQSLGLQYHIVHGLRSNPAAERLNSEQKKLLAAIRYLEEQSLIFWSVNAQASGLSEGIHPQNTPWPTYMNLRGFYLPESLFRSMDKANLVYKDGAWSKREAAAPQHSN